MGSPASWGAAWPKGCTPSHGDHSTLGLCCFQQGCPNMSCSKDQQVLEVGLTPWGTGNQRMWMSNRGIAHPHPTLHSSTCWGRAAAPHCLILPHRSPELTSPQHLAGQPGGDICPRSCTDPAAQKAAIPSLALLTSCFCTSIFSLGGFRAQRRARHAAGFANTSPWVQLPLSR